MQDVLDHLNKALAALQKMSKVSGEDARRVRQLIAALDVTLTVKTRANPIPSD